VERGRAAPDLGDYGTCARIIDWDQLSNGLLGVTVVGEGRFELYDTATQSNGLVVGEVELQQLPSPAPLGDAWQSLLAVLRSLQTHPHVQGMGLQVDYDDAWQVAYTLAQLLPLEEFLKYELLGIDNVEGLMQELDIILNQVSGEDHGGQV
jgi:Lon protease-like protein